MWLPEDESEDDSENDCFGTVPDSFPASMSAIRSMSLAKIVQMEADYKIPLGVARSADGQPLPHQSQNVEALRGKVREFVRGHYPGQVSTGIAHSS